MGRHTSQAEAADVHEDCDKATASSRRFYLMRVSSNQKKRGIRIKEKCDFCKYSDIQVVVPRVEGVGQVDDSQAVRESSRDNGGIHPGH
jgi:hypothetical protein